MFSEKGVTQTVSLRFAVLQTTDFASAPQTNSLRYLNSVSFKVLYGSFVLFRRRSRGKGAKILALARFWILLG